MKILAIDTSSLVATVAIMEDDNLLSEYTINSPMTHSQKLMPMMEELLKNNDMKIKDIDMIAVSLGPGSFTGVRIGVSTVKGLAHPFKTPIMGVSSIEAMAMNIPYCDKLICPIMDARRNQVYTGIYTWKGQELVELQNNVPLTVDELVERLKSTDREVVFLGDGIKKYRDVLKESLGDKAYFASGYVNMQRASAVGELARIKHLQGVETQSYDQLEPVYLRKSEAERQYEEKMKRLKANE